jgi:putative N-acetyltransferase (TIGR04045 family)
VNVPTSRWSAAASRPAVAPGLDCRPAACAAELAAHFRIRHQVFVVEQRLFRSGGGGRPGAGQPGGDRDARDDHPATIHVIGLAGGVIGGTVRLYPLGPPGQWKGDRLAVLPEHRRHGLGAPLVRFAVAMAATLGGQEMEAYIQPANVRFFEWLGWRPAGEIAEYAGIDHQRMVIPLVAGPPS